MLSVVCLKREIWILLREPNGRNRKSNWVESDVVLKTLKEACDIF
jgi:hypothetical protein